MNENNCLSSLVPDGGAGTLTTLGPATQPIRRQWHEVWDRALHAAGDLSDRGIGPESRIAYSGFTVDEDLIVAFLAGLTVGATVTFLPFGSQAPVEVSDFAARFSRFAPDLVVVSPPMPELGLRAGEGKVIVSADLRLDHPSGQDNLHLARVAQFTSGTTGEPRELSLGVETIAGHVQAIADASAMDSSVDSVLSWLPLHHDMGLIGGLLLPALLRMDLAILSPVAYVSDPRIWMELAAHERATLILAPPGPYAVAARHLDRMATLLDLSALRLAFVGAEPIDPAVLRRFTASAARHGFRPEAIFPVYGLAEACLAVSMPSPGSGMATSWLVDERVSAGSGGNGVELVRVGTPVHGVSVRICAESESGMGEIELQSMYKAEGATADVDGWLSTGDVGYLDGGELVVVGREDDRIFVHGRNVHPQEIERQLGHTPGLRAGNVAVIDVGRPGSPRAVIVAEVAGDRVPSHDRFRSIAGEFGLPIQQIIAAAPRSLPRTSSGKIRRHEMRRLLQRGSLPSGWSAL